MAKLRSELGSIDLFALVFGAVISLGSSATLQYLVNSDSVS
ncbi:MAG: hypothetical protein ACP5I7_07010 [Sulfolobales archaeon]